MILVGLTVGIKYKNYIAKYLLFFFYSDIIILCKCLYGVMNVKQLRLFLLLFILGFVCIPYNTSALGNEIASCNYQFTDVSGNQIKLKYQVFSDGSVRLPFGDGENYTNTNFSWYHSEQFSDKFYDAFSIDENTVTCPSIFVQQNESGFTVYPYPLSSSVCTGNCYQASASPKLSDSAKKSGIKSKKVVSSCSGSSMGFYNRQSYVYPYFRLFSDGTKEWSIDGATYVPVSEAITGSINGSEKFSISVNDSLTDSIFSSNSLTCPSSIYRCVNRVQGGYSYELSTSGNMCSNDTLSTGDGQQLGSNYANLGYGDPDDGSSDGSVTLDDLKEDLNSYNQSTTCNGILGKPGDEESVAWLLQQILNYIKILGPILVVILSSMDFAKAIIASDDESMKKAEKKLMIRLVLAVALFLVPTLVSVMLNVLGYTADGQLCLLK